jgi:hypothetical protein
LTLALLAAACVSSPLLLAGGGVAGDFGRGGFRETTGLSIRTASIGGVTWAADYCFTVAEGASCKGAEGVETWRQRSGGLEQSWVVTQPQNDVAIVVGFDAEVRVMEWDVALIRRGERVWRYGGLTAWDADGERLAVEMRPHPAGLSIHVVTAQARFPVVVDPTLTLQTEFEVAGSGGLGQAMCAGDFDGDGDQDFAIGSPAGRSSLGWDSGVVFLYWNEDGELSAAEPRQGSEPKTGDGFGGSLACADFDQDGYEDLAVGARQYASAYTDGAVYVFSGGPEGLTQFARLAESDETDGAARFGTRIAAGDVNGDGWPDLLVGADAWGPGAAGALFVYWGHDAGVEALPMVVLPPANSGSRFGRELAVGDIDGDGIADAVVTAPDTWAFVLLGHVQTPLESVLPIEIPGFVDYASVSAALGDFDGLPGDELALHFSTDEDVSSQDYNGFNLYSSLELIQTVHGPTKYSGLGRGLAPAGDVDGDGFGDLLVGAPGSQNFEDEGSVYIHYGTPAGVTPVGQQVFPDEQGGEFGLGLAGVGDLNGDGNADFLVGAPTHGEPQYYEPGKAYLYYGGCRDIDADGVCHPEDCDDFVDTTLPGAEDECGDGIDADCDGTGGPDDDEDGDGLTWTQEQQRGTSDCEPDVWDTEDTGEDNPRVDPEPRCGCSGGAPFGAFALGLLLLVGRRR